MFLSEEYLYLLSFVYYTLSYAMLYIIPILLFF